jgi:hypothetical protein
MQRPGRFAYAKLQPPSGPNRDWREPMAFDFELRNADGTPASPPTFASSIPNWKAGDVIPLGPGKMLRVMSVRPSEDPMGDPVLVVEPV